jgi:hypothetical protein
MAGKTLARWGIVLCLALCGPTAPAYAVLPQLNQPSWSALTPEQKAILAPLAKEWNEMDAFRRKKWLGIAQRYPGMSPTEQASMQRNMKEWARLAPEERKAAREKYKTLKKAAPEERQAVRQKWEEYSALPQEERDRLKKEAAPRQAPPKTPAKLSNTGQSAPAPGPATKPQRSPLSPLKPPQSTLVPKAPKPVPPTE